MSLEECQICKADATPYFHINGHICDSCYFCAKEGTRTKINEMLIDKNNQLCTLLGIATAWIIKCDLSRDKKEWWIAAAEEVIYRNNPAPPLPESKL